jgi:hypothetical protein
VQAKAALEKMGTGCSTTSGGGGGGKGGGKRP